MKTNNHNLKKMLGYVMSAVLILETFGMRTDAEELASNLKEEAVYAAVSEGDIVSGDDSISVNGEDAVSRGDTVSNGDSDEQGSVSENAAVETADVTETASEGDVEAVSGNEAYGAEADKNVMADGDSVIASGSYLGMDWVISGDGVLTISGEYDAADKSGTSWSGYKDSVLSAKVTASGVKSTASWFSGFGNLYSIDLSDFDTSQVTNMSFMFRVCSGLASLDLSGLNTGSVTNMSYMFYGCSSMTSVDLNGLNTSSVTDMSGMFYGCSSLTSLDLSSFDTGSVMYMDDMFSSCRSLTSLDLSRFDTSSVTDMGWMFSSCGRLESVNLSGFDTSSVTDMSRMFGGCSSLTSVNLSGLDTSNVTDMSSMFSGCSSLTSLDLSGFDTSSVTDMYGMFYGCSSLASLDLSGLDTSSVTGMSVMFGGCSNLTSVNLSGLDTGSVTNMREMFYGCSSLTSVDLSGCNVDNVTNMREMFYGCSSLTSVDLNGLNTGSVTDMSDMFLGCSSLTSVNLSGLDTSSVTDMYGMFYGCSSLISLDLSGLDAGSVTNMGSMFCGCSSLISLDLSSFDTGSVTDMNHMFCRCSSLTGLDLSGFDTGSVTDMSGMFGGCSSLASLDLSGFDTSSVTDMGDMFSGCSSLTSLDLSSFDTGSVEFMVWMFCGCEKLENVNVSSFDTGSVTAMSCMFWGCEGLTGLDLSSFDVGKVTDANSMLYNCHSLEQLKTPRNLNDSVKLPYTMVDEQGVVYDNLPIGQDNSILLTRLAYRIAPIPAQTYTGKALKPDVVVTYGSRVLTPGVDYTVTYKNNTNAASVEGVNAPTVIVKGKGNYSGSISEHFSILAKSMTEDNTTVASMVYTADGKLKQSVPSVTVDGKKLTANKDYTVEFPDTAEGAYKEPGCYSTVIRGKGNYQGELTASIVILAGNQIQASKLKVASVPAATYTEDETGSPVPAEPKPAVTYQGKTLTEDEDYSITYQNNDCAGKATLTITGLENTAEGGTYVYGSVTKTFTVKGTALSKAKFTYSETGTSSCKKTYTGSEIKPAITLRVGDRTLTEGKDYTVSYSKNINAGKATVTVTGKGGYTGTVKKTFTILPASAEENAVRVTFTEGKAETAYVQSGAKPEVTVTVGGTVLTLGRDYTLSYKNNKKLAGAADGKKAPMVTVKGKGNYKFQKQIPFTITAKSLSDADITAIVPDKILGAKNLLSTPVVTDAAGKKLKVRKDYTIAGYTVNGAPYDGNTAVEAGTEVTVTIRAAENGSYTGETTATYRIAERDISKTKVNKPKLEYNGGEVVLTDAMLESGILTVTYTDKATGKTDTLVYGTDYTIVGYKNNTKKGTATVTILGIGRYGGTKAVKFTIGVKKF